MDNLGLSLSILINIIDPDAIVFGGGVSKEIESLDIHVTTMFILGYPKDTIETCKATIEYAKQINSIVTQFTVFTPYPGTPAFNGYKEKILTNKYEDFTMYDLSLIHI